MNSRKIRAQEAATKSVLDLITGVIEEGYSNEAKTIAVVAPVPLVSERVVSIKVTYK